MTTIKQQQQAKEHLHRNTPGNVDDRIRIAYEWLDAQRKLDRSISQRTDLQKLISTWGGKRIDIEDIDRAAHLHDKITGQYAKYNINYRFILPAAERLRVLVQADRQTSEMRFLLENYRSYERVKYSAAGGESLMISYETEEFPTSQYDWLDFCSRNNGCKCYYCVYGR